MSVQSIRVIAREFGFEKTEPIERLLRNDLEASVYLKNGRLYGDFDEVTAYLEDMGMPIPEDYDGYDDDEEEDHEDD